MTTLRIYRGLPGSGKSTLALAWVAADPDHRARVNMDSLRLMLHDGYRNDPVTEPRVHATRNVTLGMLLSMGTDVASDDTNLNPATLVVLRDVATGLGAGVEVIDLTGVPLETCLARNAARTGFARVPDEVIHRMHTDFLQPEKITLSQPS
jgi:predicted kinase